ncbi:MAG: DUF5996 family protein [Gillisia sp.]
MEQKWPVLSYEKGKDTYDTQHMWTQILGKIKLGTLPWINHSWHVTLKITPTGLTTSTLPYRDQFFQLDLDLVNHFLIISTNKGEIRQFDLPGLSVASFYEKLFTLLKELNIDLEIYSKPVELPNPIRFEEDTLHATYEKKQATALHKALLAMQDVFIGFRCHFKGKCSDVHFFWGSFDLAVSRFSGKKAPRHPGGIPNLANWVAEEAYSHEVMSAGFWPGSEILPEAAFYCYLYPEPEGYKDAPIEPKEAYYHEELREFILPYKVVQESEDPEGKLREFLDSTYEAGARLANWDRNALED